MRLKANNAQFELPPAGNSVVFKGHVYLFPGTIMREEDKSSKDLTQRVFRCKF